MNFFSCNNCNKSADFSRTSTATAQLLHSGGRTGAKCVTQRQQPSQPRCNSVNSAARPVLPAGHFGELSAKTALSFAYRN